MSAFLVKARFMSLLVVAISIAVVGNARADSPAVIVVPFSAEGVAASEAEAMTDAAIKALSGEAGEAKRAGVGAAEVLTITGCGANDEECLATIPEVLGAELVVFGTVRNSEGSVRVLLVLIEAGRESRRHAIGLIGATQEQRQDRFGSEFAAFLKGEDAAPEDGISGDGDSDVDGVGPDEFGDATDESTGSSEFIASKKESEWRRSNVTQTSWIVLGAGATSVAVGVGFLLAGSSRESDIKNAPTSSAADLERLEELEGQARSLYTVGNILTIAGVLTAAAGGILVYRTGQVGVSPAIGADHVGLSVTLSRW